jgi:hypothetical protein
MLSLTEGDAAYPIDDATRAAILEGLAEAERDDYAPDEAIAAADKRHATGYEGSLHPARICGSRS